MGLWDSGSEITTEVTLGRLRVKRDHAVAALPSGALVDSTMSPAGVVATPTLAALCGMLGRPS